MKIDADTPPAGTIRDWIDYRAQTSGQRISHLFTDSSEPLDWASLQQEAREIALKLTALGIAKGESVALMLPNGRPGVVALFGVLYGGFRVTVINLIAGAEAVGYALWHSEARYILMGEAQSGLLEDARKAHPVQATAVRVGAEICWPEITAAEQLHEIRAEDDALLMYTSGTTGRPKGVIHSQASLLAGGWTPTLAHALTGADRAYCVLPIYHINGLCVTMIAPLVSGGSVAVAPRFSARSFWADCAEMQVTWFSVVPTIISHLLHGEADPDASTSQRIRFGRSASSALSPEVQTSFETRFGIEIVETMGLTETAAQILSNPLPPNPRKIGSPGIAWGNAVAILGAGGVPVREGREGEIAVRGPSVMQGYLKNDEATREAIGSDGWLRTGDLGHVDEDGFVFVTGRLKELIIKGGENIAPREVDDALYSHPDVIEAAAFPRECASYGQRVEAAVALAEGAMVTEADLIAICRDRLGAFKTPDAIHFFKELPKGPSGKIQRRLLGDMTPRKETSEV